MRRTALFSTAALLALAVPPRSVAAQVATAAQDTVVEAMRALGVSDAAVRLNGRYVKGDARIPAGDTVRGPLVVVGGNAEILGVVLGNVHALWGDVLVADGGEVKGSASAYRGAVVLRGGQVRGPMGSWQPATAAPASAPMSRGRALGLAGGWTAMLVVIGLAVLVLLAPNVERTARVLEQDFGRAFFLGVVGQLGFLPALLLACVALTVTVIGILLVPFVLVAAPVALAGVVTLGVLALALLSGRVLTKGAREGASRGDAVRALLAGVVLLMAPWFIAAALQGTGLAALLARVVALAVAWVAVTTGLGAALLSR
ncbi:MAG: hypothetical protein K1X31_15210, partial [Gemmatimonadaceae bacterium]|nr:hypothetical protein [Gemmatimonadaceae bacterium]